MDAATPFLDLLKNSTWVNLLVGAVLAFIAVLVPPFAAYKDTLLPTIVALVGIAVGSNTAHNIASINAEASVAKGKLAVQEAQAYAAIPVAEVAVTDEKWHERS